LAAWDGDQIVGTGRLHILSADEVQVRGMAVVPSHANNGIGSLILRELERRATRFGARRIVLHAREAALDFYRKNHYQLGDRSYTLFGSIVHWRMYKEL
jgi:GNAT superfamily N-acetyltransferase